MLDHTVIRIVEAHPDIFWQISDENKYESLTVFYKWGCDGSSGHSTYRQSFTNSDHNMVDQHLFAICIVPIQLRRGGSILWKNPRPSSTRYCRPLKVMFAKESEASGRNTTKSSHVSIIFSPKRVRFTSAFCIGIGVLNGRALTLFIGGRGRRQARSTDLQS